MLKKLFLGLAFIVLIRIGITAGFLSGVPEIRYNGTTFHQGGDQTLFYNLGKSFAELHPVKTYVPVGYPFILAPFVFLLKPADMEALYRPVLYFHSLLALIAVFLIGYMAYYMTGAVLPALSAAALWALHPVIMYLVFGLHPNGDIMRPIYISHALWFPMYSDPTSVFCVLLSFFLLLKYLQDGKKNILVYGMGAAYAAALLIRPPNIALCPIFLGVLAWQRDWRGLAKFCLCVTLLFSFQLLYNFYCNGNPIDFYASRAIDDRKIAHDENLVTFGLVNAVKYVTMISGKYASLLYGGLLCFLLASATVLGLQREKRIQWIIIIAAIVLYLLFYSTWYAFKYFPYRFLMPIVPCMAVLATGFCYAVYAKIKKQAH